jgi:CHAT domain-containing protein
VIDDSAGVVSNRFRNLVRLASREPAGEAASSAAARAIGALVFEDVAPLVRASARIFASLDGVLAGSPFETLVCPGEADPLIVAHEIVRVPSAAFLQHLRARPSSAASSVYAVAAGAPALRGARAEVNHLASRYRGVERAVDPDHDMFLAAVSSFDVVHIASHVRVESERPWNSGILVGRAQAETLADANHSAPTDTTDPLALSPSQTSEIARNLPVDPFVRASEVAAQRLDANLVVLSACESALGRTAYAEGVLGIASTFLGAGSRAVVASLWQVDDRTTVDLMRRFYHELSAGKTVAAALRSAQLTIRASRPAPFFWAGFVVIGDGDVTVQLARRRLPTGWLVAIAIPALTLVVALPWAVWRRRSRPGRIAA